MVMFENVLSHTSTQKSPKYLNLHKLPAEFYLGFFFCCLPKRVGFGGRVERARQSMVVVRAVALRNSASSQPKGPFPRHVLFGACGSDLSVVTGLLLVSVCTPLFLKQAPNPSSPCTVELSAAEGCAGGYRLPSAVDVQLPIFCLARGSSCGRT